MGSRILSRSFGVEKWRSDEDDDHEANKSMGSSMDVDEQHPTGSNAQDDNDSADEDNDDEDEEDGHDSSDTAMVPMADMLNARYGTENAKLFHEKDELKMITTKSIKCGEQIWNTYGDLPNSELLRRYGHVDILPLPNGEDGNPGDVVEIRADAVVNAVREAHPDLTTETITERIDWWLEEGGDDTFEFDLELDYPEAVLSIVRLFLLSEPDFKKAQTKGKPPKPKADGEVLPLLQKVIQQRLKEYPTSIEQNVPAGDPRVAELKAMFPDYDDAVLLTILESANGNQESALEILLGMSDPNYRPDPNAFAAPPAPMMTQEELDEQLARRLTLEEQDQQVRWQQQAYGPRRQNSRPYDQGYDSPASPPAQGGPGGRDTMTEIQDSLTKAAEVGKKTIGGLFTRVKAKIQEFEQGRSNTNQSQWAGGYDPQQQQQPYPQQAPYAQYHGSAGAASPPQASYYDPNVPSPVISEQTFSPPSRTPAPAVQGYDASPSSTAATAPSPPPATSSTAGASSVPPPASNAAPIDGGKLGLLPKRPVSLVRETPQPRRSYDSDDGLEYAENPFEEQNSKK
ncbi:hypothetical protein EST38_g843 [Candolleomyces aberdarensis]|uniref:CUE domain-containing protein n=1 Tax=Candolleomyces aberdarensis TaxID=2316362 RepID=A0A4V1Q5B7_9AGAR|nr:hypothetical protein EST38_g843 [Candolleomyces aberdarensis]